MGQRYSQGDCVREDVFMQKQTHRVYWRRHQPKKPKKLQHDRRVTDPSTWVCNRSIATSCFCGPLVRSHAIFDGIRITLHSLKPTLRNWKEMCQSNFWFNGWLVEWPWAMPLLSQLLAFNSFHMCLYVLGVCASWNRLTFMSQYRFIYWEVLMHREEIV